MADTDLEFKFGAQIEALQSGIEQAKQSIESVRGSVDKVTEGFKGLAEIAGIALSIEGFKEFVSSMAELGEQTERTMAILGTSADTVATLSLAARMKGTSTEGLTMAFSRLQLGLAQAETGSGRVKAALDAMGVSAKQMQALSIDKQAELIAQKFAGWSDGANKTAIAMALLGRQGMQMIPFLNEGAEGFRKYQEQMKDLLPDQEAFTAGAADTQHKIVTLQTAVLGFGEKLFNVMKPAIDGAIIWVTNLIKSFDQGTLQAALNKIMSIALDIVTAIVHAVSDLAALVERLLGSWTSSPLPSTRSASPPIGCTPASARRASPIPSSPPAPTPWPNPRRT
jgi:hypothetical protein